MGSKTFSPISASDVNCADIRSEFMKVIAAGWAARFTVTTRDAMVSHAVALDSQLKPYLY